MKSSLLALVAAAVVVLAVGGAARATGSAPAARLAEATMIVEVNATDGDAGLQVFLDGEPWKWMRGSSHLPRQIWRHSSLRVRSVLISIIVSVRSRLPCRRFGIAPATSLSWLTGF